MGEQVKRSNLVDWSQQLDLDQTLIGAVVRVALGKNKFNEAKYRMCVIHDVVDGERYTCGPSSIPCFRRPAALLTAGCL